MRIGKCTDNSGVEGEVYRFELEETRPDILLVNDELKTIIIIEAKDSLSKLISENQVQKSVKVVNKLSSILKGIGSNPFWNNRAKYSVITGLLWGADTKSTADERNLVFTSYYNEIISYKGLNSNLIIGIETRRVDDGLACFICEYTQDNKKLSTNKIADSFHLPLILSNNDN